MKAVLKELLIGVLIMLVMFFVTWCAAQFSQPVVI